MPDLAHFITGTHKFLLLCIINLICLLPTISINYLHKSFYS